jgi:ferredoxin-nitrite reductase
MSNSVVPFEKIRGETLNTEQKSYLEGFFAGLQNRGLSYGDAVPNPAPSGSAKPDLDQLIFEERVKQELHPLDAYPLLLEHAAANKTPERENIFRFKWNGLFHLAPKSDAFMMRLRIPGGIVKSYQLREFARAAADLTTGYIQITTRANFQLRLIQVKDAPELLRRIQSCGLSSRGTGADNIRNLTATPTSGLDPHELIDVLPYCHQLAQSIQNQREFYNLPRKFNVAFDSGGLINTVEDTNDIGLRAVRVATGTPEIPAGIYFRVGLGGATGHKAFTRDLGVLVSPAQVVPVTMALIRVYVENGNRGDRKKARLKHLLESWSLEKYLETTEKILGFQIPRAPLGPDGKSPGEEQRTLPDIPHSHVGVFPQKQSGLNYVGVAVPVGQITSKQLIRLAELADNYGSGEVRLTVWQNLIIPNVPDGFVESLKKALVKMGLHWKQSHLRGGLVACTGNAHCKFAASNTKRHAIELVDYLDKRFQLDQPVNIHLTGCPNSCAQHYMGDIGLLGTSVKVSGETLEGYHVFVGGGFGSNQALGRQIFQGVSSEALKPTLEKMFKGYLRHREPGERFAQFTRRHDLNTLQAMFSNDE